MRGQLHGLKEELLCLFTQAYALFRFSLANSLLQFELCQHKIAFCILRSQLYGLKEELLCLFTQACALFRFALVSSLLQFEFRQ